MLFNGDMRMVNENGGVDAIGHNGAAHGEQTQNQNSGREARPEKRA